MMPEWFKRLFNIKPKDNVVQMRIPALVEPIVYTTTKTKVTFTMAPIDQEVAVVLDGPIKAVKTYIFSRNFIEVSANNYINTNLVKRLKFEELPR